MRLTNFLIIPLLFIAVNTFGQAGDLSQIRNGDGKVKNGVLDACGDCWVNGNAGASNAHYTEGMSIAYRSLITGLTAGVCYEYEIGYDTYHSAMAIDYLTHFQRLEPHGPFGHAAEVINPLAMVSGSTKYNMSVVGGTSTLAIKAPAASGIASGVYDKNGNPKDVSNQAVTSFNNLPAAEKLLTMYNGILQDFNYVSQAAIVLGGADAETRVRIRFQATSDSVVLAWGGHIASRLDWGYVYKQNNLVPLSAAGISGSPYHMRQKAFDRVQCNASPQFPSTILQNFSGFGNQDRSLSAAAVFPPPDCPTVTSKTQCYESQTFSFDIDAPVSGVTYTWSFGTNTVNASFQGGVNTGNSVTVVTNTGADVQGVDNGGSFTLNIVASQNGVPQQCNGVATGTVVDVDVDANDADNAYTLNLNVTGSQALSIQSISPGTTADYNFLWKLVSSPAGSASSFTNLTAAGGATFNVLSPYATGVYTVRVIATQKSSPFCKDSSDVTIDVSGGVNCRVNGPSPVCPGSQDNVYFYDPNNDGIADAIPADFTALWSFDGLHPSATFDGGLTGNSVKVDVAALGSSCATSYTVKLSLTSTSGLTNTSCSKTVSVQDTEAPVITVCPANQNLECGSSTLPADTGEPTFTDNCGATASKSDVTDSNCNTTVITRTWTVTDLCGNSASCVQIIILKDTEAPEITCLAGGNISVTDNCSATADIVTYYTEASGVRSWTAIDASGNIATKNCNVAATLRQEVTTTSTDKAVTDEAITSNVGKKQQESSQSVESIKAVPLDPAIIQLKAEPNPFSDKVNFRFTSPVSGNARLELFTMVGQRVAVVYEGMVKAGTTYNIPYNSRGPKVATLLYNLRINDKSVNGKLIHLK